MINESLAPTAPEGVWPRGIQNLFNRLTQPNSSITDALQERRARLLATMTLVVTTLGTLIFFYQAITVGNVFQNVINWVIIAGIVIMFGAYAGARRGHIDPAATAFIATLFTVFAVLPVLPGVGGDELIFFSPLIILITAIFFSLRTTVGVAVLVFVTSVGIGALTQFEQLDWTIRLIIMSAGVIFVFIPHLRFQEQMRARELESINRQLRASEESLEIRVQERTRDLQVASDVSLQIATVLDRATLLADVAERTAAAFDLYHVSIFLYDEEENAVRLHQGVGDVGERMLEIGKQFTLDAAGLVPQAARTLRPALTNDTWGGSSHKPNPLLPDTRSELAMPMIFRNKLIGVLDLQARTADRFEDADIRIIRTLADQIAIAVRNSQLFEETRLALEAAERANAVKSTFLSSMSHELRTPMNAIINFTKFVAKGSMGPVNEQQQETLGEVIDSARHLLNLINDVLDMSKIEAGSLKLFIEENVDMNAIIKTVQANGKSLLADKPVELVIEMDSNLPAITGDRQRIMQVLLNLVSNACKFTDEGRVTVRIYPQDGEIIASVADTGAGIDAADHDLVFEAFKQTETGLRQGGGTGLGLPITRSLVEAHGGRMWFESKTDVGSTFYVALPLQSALTPAMSN